MTNQNNLVVPQAESALEQMKIEIANELGIMYGADMSARDNGRIGGEMTKRLVRLAQEQLNNNIH